MATSSIISHCLRPCRTLSPQLYRHTRTIQHRHVFRRCLVPVIQKCWISHHSFPFPDKIPTEEAARRMVLSLDNKARQLLAQELQTFEQERTDLDQSISSGMMYRVFLFNGIPFIAFGFLDNLIMIIAGEYIDATLGAALGISTMAAAGLGNLVSDVAGVGTTGYVEVLVSKLGIKLPSITPRQASTWQIRWSVAVGRAVGISLGCLIGMFPLLFFHEKEEEEHDTQTDEQKTTPATTKPEPVSTQPEPPAREPSKQDTSKK